MSKLRTALATTAVIVLSVVGGGIVMALPAQAATTAIAHVTGTDDGTNDGETADDQGADNGVEDGTNDGETADDNGAENGTNDVETNDDSGK